MSRKLMVCPSSGVCAVCRHLVFCGRARRNSTNRRCAICPISRQPEGARWLRTAGRGADRPCELLANQSSVHEPRKTPRLEPHFFDSCTLDEQNNPQTIRRDCPFVIHGRVGAARRGREERRTTELAERETCQRRTAAHARACANRNRLTTGHSLDGDGA